MTGGSGGPKSGLRKRLFEFVKLIVSSTQLLLGSLFGWLLSEIAGQFGDYQDWPNRLTMSLVIVLAMAAIVVTNREADRTFAPDCPLGKEVEGLEGRVDDLERATPEAELDELRSELSSLRDRVEVLSLPVWKRWCRAR